MGMSDCVKCWDTPCTCGHGYQSWPLKGLEEHIAMLLRVLDKKRGALEEVPDVKAEGITCVAELREALIKVSGGVGIVFQVTAEDDQGSWVMSGDFAHLPDKASFSTITLSHPSLKKLPEVK